MQTEGVEQLARRSVRWPDQAALEKLLAEMEPGVPEPSSSAGPV